MTKGFLAHGVELEAPPDGVGAACDRVGTAMPAVAAAGGGTS